MISSQSMVVELRGVRGDLVTLWEEIILDLKENNVDQNMTNTHKRGIIRCLST